MQIKVSLFVYFFIKALILQPQVRNRSRDRNRIMEFAEDCRRRLRLTQGRRSREIDAAVRGSQDKPACREYGKPACREYGKPADGGSRTFGAIGDL